MKNKSSIFYGLTLMLIFCNAITFAQKNIEEPRDSSLEANSDKWKVKEHKGMGGIAKPEFGNYKTLLAEKMDSPVIKKKRKDSLGTEVSISGDDGFNISKYKTFEKKKFYRMVLGKESDTTEIQFYVNTVSSEKRQTVISRIFSKNGGGGNEILKYQKNIEGLIFTGNGSSQSHFFIKDYISTNQITNANPTPDSSVTRGYILIKNDSLFTELTTETFGVQKSISSFQWQKGIFINDVNGHIALLQFGVDQPFYIRIRKGLDADFEGAVAGFFAVIIGVKGL